MHLNIEVTVARSCITFKRRSHRASASLHRSRIIHELDENVRAA